MKYSILILTFSHTKIKVIKKLLKHSIINTAFRTNNTIKNILDTQPKPKIYDSSRIYKLECQTFSLKYVGQTGRTFCTRYTEYVQAIRNNRSNAGFSQHILNTGHSCLRLRLIRSVSDSNLQTTHQPFIKADITKI
jgi:hypothetical protein